MAYHVAVAQNYIDKGTKGVQKHSFMFDIPTVQCARLKKILVVLKDTQIQIRQDQTNNLHEYHLRYRTPDCWA